MVDALTATVFDAEGRVQVALSWTSAPVPATAYVERVNADGSIVAVRGASPAQLVAGKWIGNDFEAPFDAPFYYRATSPDRVGTIIESQLYTLASRGETWLKHPGRPFLNTAITVSQGPDIAHAVERGVFTVLGRSRPIVLTQRRSAMTGELVVYTDDEAENAALLALLEDGSPLFLATPAGYGIGNVYISVGEISEKRISQLGREPSRFWTLPFVIVDAPSGAALAVGNSWSDVLGTYASWSQLLADEGTWTGVLEGIDD